MKNPCIDCMKRHPKCHGACADHAEWKASHRKAKEAMKEIEAYVYDSKLKLFRRCGNNGRLCR